MLKLFISGKQRAGKNKSATYISNKLSAAYPNLIVKEIAFADPINKIERYAQETLGFEEEKDRTLRIMLGGWARQHNPKIFINLALREAKLNDNVIITDGRYVNEFEALKAAGFYTLRIVANEQVRLARGADLQHLHSQSETDLDDYEKKGKFDSLIVNEGSLASLYAQLDLIIPELEVKYLQ